MMDERDGRIDLFLNLLRNEEREENDKLTYYLDKMKDGLDSHIINFEQIEKIKTIDAKLDVYEHIISIAETILNT